MLYIIIANFNLKTSLDKIKELLLKAVLVLSACFIFKTQSQREMSAVEDCLIEEQHHACLARWISQ